jgi:hypothetical protein
MGKCQWSTKFITTIRTRICNADFDIAAIEWSSVQFQSSLKSIEGAELDITEAFRAVVNLVLDNTDASHLASVEEVFDIYRAGIEWQIAKMSCIRGFCGKGKGFARRTTI